MIAGIALHKASIYHTYKCPLVDRPAPDDVVASTSSPVVPSGPSSVPSPVVPSSSLGSNTGLTVGKAAYHTSSVVCPSDAVDLSLGWLLTSPSNVLAQKHL